MKKKVLFVLPYWIRGGAEKQFRYICEEVSNCHDVDILLFNDEIGSIPNINHKFYVKNNLFKEGHKINKFILRLISYIKINLFINKNLSKYDVAICHNKLLVPVMPMLRSKCEKIIFSVREADEAFTSRIIKKILKNVDMVTCNSEATNKLINGINEKIVLINNGVEIDVSTEFLGKKSVKNIGIVANISRRKNVKLAIESLKYIDKDITISIAGKVVDNEYYKEIKEYIKFNNLENRVKFFNYIENMNDFYNKSDLIILPSLYEGTSNVILESFARKKMILMSDIPENKCLVKKSYRDSIMFDPKDVNDLVKKIKNLDVMKSALFNEIIDSNHDFIIKEYSISKLKSKYLQLI